MKILFVCLGNICRSPTAESIFRKKSFDDGVDAYFDSAGTADYHVGDSSDPRSIEHAQKRGYEMLHKGRQVKRADFENFDFVLAMDAQNKKNLLKICPPQFTHKVVLITDYCQKSNPGEIPDPYYGTAQDFELVIDLLEDAYAGFAKKHFYASPKS
jgi:protein-tyrosine-phosphatase